MTWDVSKDTCEICGWRDKESGFCTYCDEIKYSEETCFMGISEEEFSDKFYKSGGDE